MEHSHPYLLMYYMTLFALQCQKYVVAIETGSLKYLLSDPFQKKFAEPCSRLIYSSEELFWEFHFSSVTTHLIWVPLYRAFVLCLSRWELTTLDLMYAEILKMDKMDASFYVFFFLRWQLLSNGKLLKRNTVEQRNRYLIV